MKKITLLFFTFLMLFSASNVFSQLSEIDFNSKVSQSSAIIEGRVIGQTSFWDVGQKNIYTAHTIEVFKVFKGNLTSSTIELITPGGTVGLNKETVEPSIEVEINEVGIFMLKTNTVLGKSSTAPQYEPYASIQGFVKYDLGANKAFGPFDNFNNIQNTLYNAIDNVTNSTYSTITPFPTVTNIKGQQTNKAIPTITSFSPTTATAGTGTTITITGTSFGTVTGLVSFSNADDGGATFEDGLVSEIISWSNTQIIVEVNARAGTGPIQVTNVDGSAISATNLTVSYALTNVVSNAINSVSDIAYRSQHIDDDANGGYTWQMFTDFDADADANAAFIRAMNTWRCSTTNINWSIGAVTTTDVIANDGINVIRHDNGSELPNGVLGRCTSRFSGCFANSGTDLDWSVSELDIVFDDGINWNYSTNAPGFAEFDFESVALHELGHGHQLGHVIDPNDVMHFSISNGDMQRSPSINNINAGNDVMTRSTTTSICNEGSMTPFALPTAGVITGSNMETENAVGILYSITAIPSATSYTWTVPPGASIASGQGTTSITIDFGTTSGDVTVTPIGPCGNGTASDLAVTISAPANPGPSINPAFCNITLAAIGDEIRSIEVPNATQYEFQLVPQGGGPTINYLSCCLFRLKFNQFTGWTYNTTYDVSVRTMVGGVFTDFGISCPITTPPIPVTEINPVFCNTTLASPTSKIRAIEITGATQYQFRLVPQGGGTTITDISDFSYILRFSSFSGWAYNTTYDISVRAFIDGAFTSYGPSCPITTPSLPTPEINAVFCNTTLASPTSKIRAIEIAGATQYQFRLVPQGGGTTITDISDFSYILSFSSFSDWSYNTTYDVSVRAFIDGAFTSYGPSCPITTPSLPTPEVNPAFCNTTLASPSSQIRAIEIAGATQYQFRLVPQSGGATITDISDISYILRMNSFSSWMPNTTYDVSVRAFIDGAFTSYGLSCPITTPSTLMLRNGNNTDDNLFSTTNIHSELDVNIYPNPNQGESVYLELQGLSENTQAYVIDISGRTILYKSLNNDDQNMNLNLTFNEKLTPGFYFINIISGSKKITKKLIVQ